MLKSWQTGACGKVSLASGRAGQLVPAPLPPRPARPEARRSRPPRPRQLRFASFGACHEGCFPLPATRAVIYSAAKTAPAPADAGPPALAALKITASCGRTVWPACHAHCCTAPRPPLAVQCARQSGLASFTPHPSLRFLVQFGGVAAHPPTRTLAPSIPGGCACTKKRRPVTDAKEVGVGNAAEETFCHRTVAFLSHPSTTYYPFLVIDCAFFVYKPRSLRCVTVRDFVATRYRSASAASSPPTPSSSASTFSTSSGRFGSCCIAGKVSARRPHRR